jgi:hypothetical protein
MMEQPNLLHNMSAPPGTVVAHEAPPSRSAYLAFHFKHLNADPQNLLWRLDKDYPPGTPEDAERELRRRINERAAALPLPAAAIVVSRTVNGARYSRDLLTICTVLSKSSGRVYLRDKEPNLANIRHDRTVVLQLPANSAQGGERA